MSPEFQRDNQPPRSDSNRFRSSLGISIALHSLVISLFFVKILFFSEPLLDLSQAINVSIGDIRDNRLPEKIQEPAQEEETPEDITDEVTAQNKEPEKKKPKVPVKEKPKTDEISLKKTKAKQKSALDKLKKLSALEKIKQSLKQDSIAKLKVKKSGRSHVVPAGSALTGLDKIQAATYLGQLDQTIKQFWTLPQWLINKPLKAQILLKFNQAGNILSTQILATSGNTSYDQYCLQAIEKAAPFPAVPAKLSEKFSIDGIVIGFPE